VRLHASAGGSALPYALARRCPIGIPRGINRNDVLIALRELDRGVDHDFGRPTRYALLHEGSDYAPKAAIGLAAKRVLGRYLLNHEFSGGEGSGQANERLRRLGFDVGPLRQQTRLSMPGPHPPSPQTDVWDIKPGDSLRRQEVHAAYGGALRGGIEPSARRPTC
jgi:hypothetical protein